MNMLKIGKARYNKKRSAYCRPFLSIALCALILTVTISTCYISVPVMADVTGWQYICTVWELIISLTVGSGAAPVSNAVNDAGMASQLGQMTVAELASGEVSVAQADAAIQALTSSSNAAQQAAGGIAQSFASTAADAAQAAEAISAAGIDGVQAAEGAMSAGENLANTAAASVSVGSLVGMLGMEFTGAAAIGAAGVAVVAGVGLGILGHNIIDYFSKNLKSNAPLTTPNEVLNTLNPSYGYGQVIRSDGKVYYYTGLNDSQKVGVIQTNNYKCLRVKGGTRFIYGKDGKLSSKTQVSDIFSDISGYNTGINGYPIYNVDRNGSINSTDADKIMNGTIQSTTPNTENPDIVTPNGNISYNPTTNNYNYNYQNNPTYNTTNKTLRPIYNNEYKQFINETNQNTVNNIDNSQTFQNFINNYLDDVTVPAPDTDPDIPTQPDKPTNPDITPEQEEQNKELMLPSNLKDYFPFCIPFDIYVLFTKFDDIEREAPHLQFELDLQRAGKYQIDIDFSDYDDLASLLRLLELIGFIMLLMVGARKIIGD